MPQAPTGSRRGRRCLLRETVSSGDGGRAHGERRDADGPEYHLVTKGLLTQITQLQEQFQQQLALNQQQAHLLAQLQQDQQRLLLALGISPATGAEAAPATGALTAPVDPLGLAQDPLWAAILPLDPLPQFPAIDLS